MSADYSASRSGDVVTVVLDDFRRGAPSVRTVVESGSLLRRGEKVGTIERTRPHSGVWRVSVTTTPLAVLSDDVVNHALYMLSLFVGPQTPGLNSRSQIVAAQVREAVKSFGHPS